MKQYTKEEIAACVKVVWLQNDQGDFYMWSASPQEMLMVGAGPLPNRLHYLSIHQLHNPGQYLWPEPGKCVEYRLEPSLMDDLRGLVSLLDKQISQLDDISAFNLIYKGALSMSKAYKSALEDIINKHYPES